MAANDTTLTIIGNLTADPELRISASGVSWIRFTVASTPRMFDKASNQYRDGEALFLTCTAWRDLADHIAESVTKGTRVIVSGRLKQNRWETPEGDKRTTYGLEVDEIGPSLRFATARVERLIRSHGPTDGGADSWASTTDTGNGASVEAVPPF